jgi:predicted dehydrogenase
MKQPWEPIITRRRFAFLGAAAWTAVHVTPRQAGRRIGFVDDNLDNFHARIYLEVLRTACKPRGFVVTAATALQGEKGRRWAEQHHVPYFDSVDQLAPHVDYFAVLAPSTPETHLPLCRQVLPLGKPTFVDKTFAPDPQTGAEIFALADRYGTPIQSSSALRYTAVQRYVARVGRKRLRHIVAWGGGASFKEYAVHPLELVISCMGPDVERLMRRGEEPYTQLLLDFRGGRTAVVNVYTKTRTPFAAAVTTDEETRFFEIDGSQLFVDAAHGMLDFFEAGKPLIDRRETMAILHLLALARDPRSRTMALQLPPF